MFAVYMDASGKTEDITKPGDPVLSLAGYVAPVERWEECGVAWRKMLCDYCLSRAHQTDFAQNWGEYIGWNKDEAKRRGYVTRCTEMINDTVQAGFVTAVLLKDWQRVANRGVDSETDAVLDNDAAYEPVSAFKFVAVETIKQIAIWAHENKLTERIAYLFEPGDGRNAEIVQMREALQSSAELVNGYKFNSLTIIEPRDPLHVQVQTADWLAYETGKYLRDTKLNTVDPRKMRETFRLIWKPGKLRTRFYNEKDLLGLCKSNLAEMRRLGIRA